MKYWVNHSILNLCVFELVPCFIQAVACIDLHTCDYAALIAPTGYDVRDNFSVAASFWLDVRPIEKAIEDDRRRRAIYGEMIVNEYPWRN